MPVRRLVLNDVGPTLQWQAIQRIGAYLGQSGHFNSVQEAADAMWKISESFGPHTPEQWLALSRPMIKPVSPDAGSPLRLHYDPAIAGPFRLSTEEGAQQGEAMLWQLYDGIQAANAGAARRTVRFAEPGNRPSHDATRPARQSGRV